MGGRGDQGVDLGRRHPIRSGGRRLAGVKMLLFGWTVLGWGIALIWAVSGPNYRVEAPRELDWATQQRRAMIERDGVR